MVVPIPEDAIIGVSAEEWDWLEEMGIEKEDTDLMPTEARSEDVHICHDADPVTSTIGDVSESSLAEKLVGLSERDEDDAVTEPLTWTHVPLSPRQHSDTVTDESRIRYHRDESLGEGGLPLGEMAANGSEDVPKELIPANETKDQVCEHVNIVRQSTTDADGTGMQDPGSDSSHDEACSEEETEEEENQRLSRYDSWQQDLQRFVRASEDSFQLRRVAVVVPKEDNHVGAADRSDSASTGQHPAEAEDETASVVSDGDRSDLESMAPLARVESHQELPKRTFGLSAAQVLQLPSKPCPTITERLDAAGPKTHRPLSPSPLRQVLNSSDLDPESPTSPAKSWSELNVSPEDSILVQTSDSSDVDPQSPLSLTESWNELMEFPEDDLVPAVSSSNDQDPQTLQSQADSANQQNASPQEDILVAVPGSSDQDSQSSPSSVESSNQQNVSLEDDTLAPVLISGDLDVQPPPLPVEESNERNVSSDVEIMSPVSNSGDLDPQSSSLPVESPSEVNVPLEEDPPVPVSSSNDQDPPSPPSPVKSSSELNVSSKDDILAKVLENCIQSAHALLSQGSNKQTLARSREIANLMGNLLKDKTSPLNDASGKQGSLSDLIDGSAWRGV